MPTRGLKPAELLARNVEWCEDKSATDAELLKQNALGQNPSILWIGCSDSRVPESVVAKCNPGDIFTHRNIAGQFSETDDSAMSVLTYAVEALGVEYIVIVGHTSCGGVLASLASAKDVSTPLPSPELERFLKPLVDLCTSVRKELGIKEGEEPSAELQATLLRKATEANVQAQVEKVVASKIVQSNWAGKNLSFPGKPKHKVKVHGWLHDISAGKLIDLNVARTPPE
ncbi:hypothetical protein CBS101457_000425 [Exobasidium rhododendri]|nr:hypothetical protein CBS101457_000425 [Exobasidium rhododendri]